MPLSNTSVSDSADWCVSLRNETVMHMVIKYELLFAAIKLSACSQRLIIIVTLFVTFHICRFEFDVCKLCCTCCSRLW
jgi:hypothetical protein